MEQFFGRLCAKFTVFRTRYEYDHGNFDVDFTNACYLINEDILNAELAEEDYDLYRKVLTRRLRDSNEAEKKRRAERERYGRRKRQRLARVDEYVRE